MRGDYRVRSVFPPHKLEYRSSRSGAIKRCQALAALEGTTYEVWERRAGGSGPAWRIVGFTRPSQPDDFTEGYG